MHIRTLLVDSRDRILAEDPEPSAYTVRLPESLHHVSGVRLMSAEFPNIQTIEGILVLYVNGAPVTLTMPQAVYTDASIAELVALQLGPDFVVAVDPSTSRLVIRDIADAAATIRVLGGTPLATALGFPAPETLGTGGTVRATHPITLRPNINIFVSSPSLQGAVADVPLNASLGVYVFFADCGRSDFHPLRPPLFSLNTLRIEFRTRAGALVDFQGLDHALTLEFLTASTAVDGRKRGLPDHTHPQKCHDQFPVNC